MRVDVVTIFPRMFPGPLGDGIMGRAISRGLVELVAHDLRDYAPQPHRQVDDEPFGGGAGMVLMPGPLFAAVEAIHKTVRREELKLPGPTVLMSPQGARLDQDSVQRLSRLPQVTILCGRYEGVDERVRTHLVDEEVSIGDFVLTGGELPSMVLIEAMARLLPGALGAPESVLHESFVGGLLDHPQFTRPASFRGIDVPDVLRSGNHQRIREWRGRAALENTARKRPDLLRGTSLTDTERRRLAMRGIGLEELVDGKDSCVSEESSDRADGDDKLLS